jgi:hypothetical protein
MVRHLQACPARKAAIEAAEEEDRATQTLYHLYVKDAWGGDYWLHLEMNGEARLEALDDYLRAIWLECCGHLSRFGGWSESEIPKGRKAKDVFTPGMEVEHIYDFGSSSHTVIRVSGEREGAPLTRHPIYLMARNNPPEATCMACDQPAAWLCLECIYEEQTSGLLCDEHKTQHQHRAYGEPMPLVNSPRVGMCGYCGPAEPPY